jgi:outer membrane protein assembly factor BamB
MKVTQNKRIIILGIYVLAVASFSFLNAQSSIPSGLSDIDQIRKEILVSSTNNDTYKSRKSAFYRWWRLYWRQGYDLKQLDSISNQLLISKGTRKKFSTLDAAYSQFEDYVKKGQKIKEVKGTRIKGKSSKTNWPFFFGTDKEQIGHSPDIGPSKGKISWKFPKGYHSDAHPIIENGKVYLTSPGIDVNGYCLNENNGEILWRSRQMGVSFYGDPGSRWSPIVTDETVIIRNDYTEEFIHIYDKKNGKELSNHLGSTDVKLFYYTRKGKTIVATDKTTGKDFWVKQFEDYVTNQPIWKNGQVFVALRNGKVFCLDEKTKAVLWEVQLDSELTGTPSIAKNLLFVGDKSGKLHALKIKTGVSQFVFSAHKNNTRAHQFFSRVVYNNDRIYVGSAANELYCLNFKGELIWTLPVSDWVRSAPTIVDNKIYVATFDAKLYTIEDKGKKGKILRKIKIGEHPITADLVSSKATVLVADQGLVLYAVSTKTSDIKWRHGIVDGIITEDNYVMADWSGGLLGTPTVVDDVAYIGGSDGFVNAVDIKSGKEIWRFETNSTVSLAPTVIGDKVFFGYLGANTEHYGYDNPGEYFAVNKDTGAPIWTSKEFGRVWVSPSYNDGILFFGNTDGFVFAIDPNNGATLWSYNTAKDTSKEHIPLSAPFRHGFPSGVYSIPVNDDVNFYVGSWSGYYFAFDQKTGILKWRVKTSANDYGGLPDSAALMLNNNYLYVQEKGAWITAINVITGKIDWRWKGTPGYLQNATVTGGDKGRFYGSIANRVTELPYFSEVIAFDNIENGGGILWKTRGVGGLTPAITSKSQIISGSSCGMFISSLDPKTGKLLWRVYTGGEMLENAPAIYGNQVFALCKNGYLYAIE